MNITKTMVYAKTRQLSAEWTLEQTQELSAYLDDIVAKEIAAEIEKSIAFDLCVNRIGWTVVVTESIVDHNWMATHMQHRWVSFNEKYAFESSYDSVLFVLRWS